MSKKRNATDTDRPALTLREAQIAIGIAAGETYPEIGKTLGLGYETVRSYVNRLRAKTQRRRKTELAIWASNASDWLRARVTTLKAAAKKKGKAHAGVSTD